MKRFVLQFTSQIALTVLIFGLAPSALAVTENSYRWRGDETTEDSATYAAAENAPLGAAPIDVAKRLRFGVTNSGSEAEFVRKAGAAMEDGDDKLRTSVIDTTNGFVYFGSTTTPGRIVKVRLSNFSYVTSLQLNAGENLLASASIDVAAGFAYFGTDTAPGKVVKIRLSDFTEVGAITLAAGENNLLSSIIDTVSGFIYFGTNTSPGKVAKIDLTSFTEVGTALTLAAGENVLQSAVIDTTATPHLAYFGTNTSPGKVAKIDLTSFTEVGTALTLAANENNLFTGIIDTTATPHFVYFSTLTSPSRIAKINLTSFTEVGTALVLGTGVNSVESAVIDTAGGSAYFGAYTSLGLVSKVSLTTFTETGVLTLSGGASLVSSEGLLFSASIDPAAGFAYFGTDTRAGIIIKVRLSDLTRNAALTLTGSDSNLDSMLIDSAAGFMYTNSFTGPGRILKVRLSDLVKVGTINLEPGEDAGRHAAFLDLTNGFAYFATVTSPAKIIKVRLSDFTKVGVLTLSAGNNSAGSAVVDLVSGFAYIGTRTTPGRIVKIRLSDFTEVGSFALNTGEDFVNAAVIDTAAGFAYFGVFTSPGKVAKIDLSTFTQVATFSSVGGAIAFRSAVIDTTTTPHFAYFGGQQSPGRISKINLTTFTETAVLTLTGNEANIFHAAIDTANGFAYFTTFNTFAAGVNAVKVRLSDFTRVGPLAPASLEESQPFSIALDVPRGYAYQGAGFSPSNIVKVSVAPHNEFRLEYGLKSTTCAAISSWTQVPTTATAEHWKMSESPFLVDGAATTNSAGLTDGNISFQSGQVKDASSQTSEISLGEKQFTELEYNIKPTDSASVGSVYCFRLTNAGSATGFNFGQYAEATVAVKPPSGSGACTFLIRPNGGEHLNAGQTFDITWSHSVCPTAKVRLSLSTDGGANYPTVIAANEADDGSYAWTVPIVSTASAKVRLEAFGADGAIQSVDASDGDLSIASSGSGVTVPPPAIPPPSAMPGILNYDPAAESVAATSIDADQGWARAAGPSNCIEGTVFKAVSAKAVYYCGSDSKRHVFPNEKTYKTWFADFSHVLTLSDATVASIPEGKHVTYKPGVRMIKLTTDNKVYAVSKGGVLRWIETEAVAVQLYGADWNMKIDDVPQSIFEEYTIGESIK